MLTRGFSILWVVSIMAAMLIMYSTDPATVHPGVLLLLFLLLYVFFVGVIFFGIVAITKIVQRKKTNNGGRATVVAYMYATILGLAPVILLAMNSVGAIGSLEVVLIVAFEVVACFYIWRRL